LFPNVDSTEKKIEPDEKVGYISSQGKLCHFRDSNPRRFFSIHRDSETFVNPGPQHPTTDPLEVVHGKVSLGE